MKQFKVNNTEVLAVVVPDGAYDFTMGTGRVNFIEYTCRIGKEVWYDTIKLPYGDWSILGRVQDLTTKQVCEAFNIDLSDIGDMESTLIHISNNANDTDLILIKTTKDEN